VSERDMSERDVSEATTRELGVTPAGCDALDRLITARRARLAELFAEWPPETHEKLALLLGQIARELVPARMSGDSNDSSAA
jgi:hypothetical protein